MHRTCLASTLPHRRGRIKILPERVYVCSRAQRHPPNWLNSFSFFKPHRLPRKNIQYQFSNVANFTFSFRNVANFTFVIPALSTFMRQLKFESIFAISLKVCIANLAKLFWNRIRMVIFTLKPLQNVSPNENQHEMEATSASSESISNLVSN